MNARRNRFVLILTGLALSTLCDVGFTDARSKQAEAVQYQGRQRNPLVFESVTLPAIETKWISRVDLSDHPSVSMTVVAVSRGPFDAVTPGGVLLIDPRGILQVNAAVRRGTVRETRHEVPIPSDPALVGLGLSAQAALLSDAGGGTLRLTNGIRLRLGFSDTP